MTKINELIHKYADIATGIADSGTRGDYTFFDILAEFYAEAFEGSLTLGQELTEREVENLPVGSIVRDCDDDVWTRKKDGPYAWQMGGVPCSTQRGLLVNTVPRFLCALEMERSEDHREHHDLHPDGGGARASPPPGCTGKWSWRRTRTS